MSARKLTCGARDSGEECGRPGLAIYKSWGSAFCGQHLTGLCSTLSTQFDVINPDHADMILSAVADVDSPAWYAVADLCEEIGDLDSARYIREVTLKYPAGIRDVYNWSNAFAYANTPDECPPNSDVNVAVFTMEDVKRVIAVRQGENDADDWLGVFELHDGRFAYLKAGCDYTGWD